jgi:hypothetical protein
LNYKGALAVFLGYVCDPRYGWVTECEQQVGARPVQVCHEGNTACTRRSTMAGRSGGR